MNMKSHIWPWGNNSSKFQMSPTNDNESSDKFKTIASFLDM